MPAADTRLSFDPEWRTTLFTLVLVPLMTWLGFWQLQRAEEKTVMAASWEQRQSQPPVPLEQLWRRLPAVARQELLGQLTRILAQRLAPLNQEAADE